MMKRHFNLWFVCLLLSGGLVFSAASSNPTKEIRVEDRPEGVAKGIGAAKLLIGQILSGEILSVNVLTGAQRTVVQPSDNGERQAWGLEYAPLFNALIVAGGGPSFGGGKPEVYVYSATSGKLMATCESTTAGSFGSFLNDVAVIGDTAYITDSKTASVMTLDIKAAMRGNCDVGSIDLPEVFDATFADDFAANGIVPYHDGLIVTNEFDASLWYVNIEDPSDTRQVLPDNSVPGADGLIMRGDTLYVTLNAVDQIAAYELSVDDDTGIIQAEEKGCYSSDTLEAPSTSAIVKNYIYSANSRFFTFPDPADPNQPQNTVIGIPLADLGACNRRRALESSSVEGEGRM